MKIGDIILLTADLGKIKGKYLIEITEFASNGLIGFFLCLNYKHSVKDHWSEGKWTWDSIEHIEIL